MNKQLLLMVEESGNQESSRDFKERKAKMTAKNNKYKAEHFVSLRDARKAKSNEHHSQDR